MIVWCRFCFLINECIHLLDQLFDGIVLDDCRCIRKNVPINAKTFQCHQLRKFVSNYAMKLSLNEWPRYLMNNILTDVQKSWSPISICGLSMKMFYCDTKCKWNAVRCLIFVADVDLVYEDLQVVNNFHN